MDPAARGSNRLAFQRRSSGRSGYSCCRRASRPSCGSFSRSARSIFSTWPSAMAWTMAALFGLSAWCYVDRFVSHYLYLVQQAPYNNAHFTTKKGRVRPTDLPISLNPGFQKTEDTMRASRYRIDTQTETPADAEI